MLLKEDAGDDQERGNAEEGGKRSATAVVPRQTFAGSDRAGSGAKTAAAAARLERNALLLGWVRLVLLPPPLASVAVDVEARDDGDDGQNAGSQDEAMEVDDHGLGAEDKSAQNGVAALANGESRVALASDQRDSRDEEGPAGNTSTTTKKRRTNKRNKSSKTKTRKNVRDGSVPGTLRPADAADAKTIRTPPKVPRPPRSTTDDRGEGRAALSTGSPRGGVLRAGPNTVWFNVPSARLATELPEEWVAFADVSGGILADVSSTILRVCSGFGSGVVCAGYV